MSFGRLGQHFFPMSGQHFQHFANMPTSVRMTYHLGGLRDMTQRQHFLLSGGVGDCKDGGGGSVGCGHIAESLVVSTFGDTREGDDGSAHIDAHTEGTIFHVQGDQGIS